MFLNGFHRDVQNLNVLRKLVYKDLTHDGFVHDNGIHTAECFLRHLLKDMLNI